MPKPLLTRKQMRESAALSEPAADGGYAASEGGPRPPTGGMLPNHNHIMRLTFSRVTGQIITRPRRDKGKGREESEDDNDQDGVEEVVGSDEAEIEEERYVYHHEIFHRLVAVASDNGALKYVNEEPTHGPDLWDVTAYRASQKTWAKVLAHRPENLFLWKAPSPFNDPTGRICKMRFDGHIVLDCTGKPIRIFDIPWAISSAVEGWRVEAWLRADKRLRIADIVARIYTKPKGKTRVPLYHERSLATRAKRFREEAGLVCWGTQHAKPEAVAYFQSLRSDAQKCHNLAVQRDLTMAERSHYTLITMGRNVDRDGAGAAAQISWEKYVGRHRRNARENYPNGEFEPGARDAGDLFEDSIGGSDDRTEGAMNILSGNLVPSPSDPASSPRTVPTYQRNATVTLSGPMAAEAHAFGDNEEAQDRDDHSNAESWQDSPSTTSAAASYAHRQAAEDYNDILSEISLRSELEDPTDSRNDEPTTVEEAQMLQSALEQTIADFHELSGGSIPSQTNPAENYLSQWAALQTQFNFIWRGLWDNSNAPTLRGLDRWVGGIANWGTAGLARSDRAIADEEAWAMYFGG